VEGEFVERDVAGVAACGVGIGGQAVNDRAVGEADFKLLDRGAFKEGGLAGLGHDAARLNMFLHLLHQQAGLALALGEEDPRGLLVEAAEHGAQGGGERIADLPRLGDDLERRVVLDPATLIGQ
jgi:hypothetical protein